jgi:hypothetical protein
MSRGKWALIAATWALAATLSNGVLIATPASAAPKEIASTCLRPPWCS